MEKIFEHLKDRISDYVDGQDYKHEGGEYDDVDCFHIYYENIEAYIEVKISGTYHKLGATHLQPSEEWGEKIVSVTKAEIHRGEELLFSGENVKELSLTILF